MNEEVQREGSFVPFPRFHVQSKEDALKELITPASRFRLPFTLWDRLRIFLSNFFQSFDMLSNATDVISPDTPLNWQVILRYLHASGVIESPSFHYSARSNDLPKVYGIELRAKPTKSVTDGKLLSEYSYASSPSIEIALSKAVGEMLERYFLTLYKREDLVHATYQRLLRSRVQPLNISHLNTFLEWQEKMEPRFKKTVSSALYWVQGEKLNGSAAYIPAQYVFWNYDYAHDPEEPILVHCTTNAAGGHFTKTEAILSGVLEHIERDGFLIYWLNSLSPRQIDARSINDADLRALFASLDRYGLEMHFLNTTTDTAIPSVTSVLIDRRKKDPVLVISAACGFTLRDTVLKSGEEALNILQYGSKRKDFSLPERYEPFRDSQIGQTERIVMWKGDAMLKKFSFFLQGEVQSPQDFIGATPQTLSPKERLDYIARSLSALGEGYEIYLYEAKHPVLKKLGFHVVQTLVPKLIPMYLNERLATLNAPRLKTVPETLGFKAAHTLNPLPHPFP